MPTAAIEVLLLFGAVTFAALLFVAQWLTPNQGVVLTALLLLLLLGLWGRNLNHGRRPCFLFLGMLLLVVGACEDATLSDRSYSGVEAVLGSPLVEAGPATGAAMVPRTAAWHSVKALSC